MSSTETNNNKEILEHNLKVIDGDRQLWNDFLEQAAVKPLRWIPSANTQFNRINIEDDKLYLFTWPYPTPPIYDIITEDFVWDDVYVNLAIEETCELKPAGNMEPCFWEKVVNAIRAGDDNTSRQLLSGIPNREETQRILKPKSTEEIAENLKKALESPGSKNHKRYASFGRIFLLHLVMNRKTIKSIQGFSSHKYVLYLFVDDQYFQKVFGKEMGVRYEK
jgi:hypothetical protein